MIVRAIQAVCCATLFKPVGLERAGYCDFSLDHRKMLVPRVEDLCFRSRLSAS